MAIGRFRPKAGAFRQPAQKRRGMPDLNGPQRGMGYGGALNPRSPNYGNFQGGGQPGQAPPQRDYFAEFNAWRSPNISDGGVSAGQLQPGYGGFSALNAQGGMMPVKMNQWLNTFDVGGDRERAMNAVGYFNSGNPYTPQFQKQHSGSSGYTTPGIYQHQARPPTMRPDGSMDLNSVGGYTGATTVGNDLSSQYQSFGSQGMKKSAPRPIGAGFPGGRPIGSQIRPGGPGQGNPYRGGGVGPQRDGRMPNNPGPQRVSHNQIGQKGKGKGKKKPPGRRGNRPGGSPPMRPSDVGGFPDFNQGKPEGFLPQTPQFELDQAAASGELLGAGQQYGAGNDILANQLALERTRIGTDQGIARNRLDESLAERGLITSGLRAKAQTEQVATPYGRQLQDLATAGARGYGDLASQYGGANFGYTTDMMNAYMQRANDAYSQDLYGTNYGQYSAPDQAGFQPYYPPRNPPKKPPKKGGGGKKRNRRRNRGR